MHIYGDPQFAARPGEMLAWMRARLEEVNDLDGLRAALIQAGQLEQAVADQWQPSDVRQESGAPLIAASQKLTDALATAFVASWPTATPLPLHTQTVRACLDALDRCLLTSPAQAGTSLQVKVPEGFEFYALYPEQYVFSARAWAGAHAAAPSQSAMVIGVRGIGTTLSAVIAAALRAAGWTGQRSTVRPVGHPYNRTVSLEHLPPGDEFWALIVDEGPGLSGSSLASVAEALARRGLDPNRIVFFPGHPGEPGPAASERTRHWWSIVPRWVTSLEEINWPWHIGAGSQTQPSSRPQFFDLLRIRSQALLQCDREAITPHDVSGGGWREVAYTRREDWPAVAARFERPKYLYQIAAGRGVLWKFVGLGSLVEPNATEPDLARAQLRRLAERGWVPRPIDALHGFLATPWIKGQLLAGSDRQQPQILSSLAAYLLDAAGPALSRAEQSAACQRLIELTVNNLREACGDDSAAVVQAILQPIGQHQPSRSYGDGRMMPYKWVLPQGTSAGTSSTAGLLKLDCAGHAHDHTCIGKQSVLWDVAGVLVEWQLDAAAYDEFLELLRQGLPDLQEGALASYTLAYAAFRLGLMVLCLNAEPADSEEAPRLRRAREFYAAAARRLMSPQ